MVECVKEEKPFLRANVIKTDEIKTAFLIIGTLSQCKIV